MPNSPEFHAEQLRACAAIGGHVEVTEVGCDDASTMPAAQMLANPTAFGPAYRQIQAARARVVAAAALPGSSPDAITRHAEELVSLSAAALARKFADVEHAGGEVRYREAS